MPSRVKPDPLRSFRDHARWAPTPKQMLQIRWILCMTNKQHFLRCQARDRTKMRAFEKMGDFSHSKASHVCKDCRCSHIAGAATKGDFYGIGENTGHYGVGWCKWHETGGRRSMHESFARNQMDVLQQVGRARSDNMGEFVEVVADNAAVYSMVDQVRKSSSLILHHMEEFKKICAEGELTETGKFGPQQASDETRIRLACEVAKTIASITKTELDISSKRMISIEEVVMRIKMEMDLVRRFVTDPREQIRYFEEFKSIWKSVVDKGGGNAS